MAERKSLRDAAFALVFALQTLFPPHPLAFSRLAAIKGADKSAPIILKAATYADYAEHLSPDAYNGVGAIGAFPGLSEKNDQGESQWFTRYFCRRLRHESDSRA